MLKGFGQFIARGNVVDLAVAVVIGAAFSSIVTSLVKDLITPLIAAVVGKPDFSSLAFVINGSQFRVGDFINSIVSFVLVSAAIYYFVVVPLNVVSSRLRPKTIETPLFRDCPQCLSEVPREALRCKFCTSALASA